MLVRILKYWQYPNLLRQTPNCAGNWRGIRFLIDEPGAADYVVLHGHARGPALVRCPGDRVWLVMGEAPTEHRAAWHDIPGWIDRAYVTDETRVGPGNPRYRLATAHLPWWVDLTFDQLVALPPPRKTADLSWVTSDNRALEGHRHRMRFLDRVRGLGALRLFGRGFQPVQGKWEALWPYRYSIAFENFSNAMYFSEKVMDCFLAWAMPIYYGCTDLNRFFPRESYVQLDPQHPDPERFLRDVISSDLREANLGAIAEARRRVLYDYNLFNLIATEVERQEQSQPSATQPRRARLILDHTRGWKQFEPDCVRDCRRAAVRWFSEGLGCCHAGGQPT
jgi:hypothetical protein